MTEFVPFSIILVSYNSADVLGEAIASVPKGHEVIVVDNASGDDSVAIAEKAGASVIALDENLGFGTACNRGAAAAKHDALLFLNPDARLQDGAIEALTAAMARYPNAMAFNPRIIDASGHEFYRNKNRLIDNRKWFDGPASGDRKIPMAVGAAALFRRADFEALGGYDEDIFLYFEDVDISARIIQAGRDILHIQDAVAVHLIAQSTPPSDAVAAFKNYHFAKAKLYVMKKHGKFANRYLLAASQAFDLMVAKITGNHDKQIMARNRLKALMEG